MYQEVEENYHFKGAKYESSAKRDSAAARLS